MSQSSIEVGISSDESRYSRRRNACGNTSSSNAPLAGLSRASSGVKDAPVSLRERRPCRLRLSLLLGRQRLRGRVHARRARWSARRRSRRRLPSVRAGRTGVPALSDPNCMDRCAALRDELAVLRRRGAAAQPHHRARRSGSCSCRLHQRNAHGDPSARILDPGDVGPRRIVRRHQVVDRYLIAIGKLGSLPGRRSRAVRRLRHRWLTASPRPGRTDAAGTGRSGSRDAESSAPRGDGRAAPGRARSPALRRAGGGPCDTGLRAHGNGRRRALSVGPDRDHPVEVVDFVEEAGVEQQRSGRPAAARRARPPATGRMRRTSVASAAVRAR